MLFFFFSHFKNIFFADFFFFFYCPNCNNKNKNFNDKELKAYVLKKGHAKSYQTVEWWGVVYKTQKRVTVRLYVLLCIVLN